MAVGTSWQTVGPGSRIDETQRTDGGATTSNLRRTGGGTANAATETRRRWPGGETRSDLGAEPKLASATSTRTHGTPEEGQSSDLNEDGVSAAKSFSKTVCMPAGGSCATTCFLLVL